MKDQSSEFVEDLEQCIVTSQSLLTEYTEIFVKIRLLGENFVGEFGETHANVTKYVTDFIYKTR